MNVCVSRRSTVGRRQVVGVVGGGEGVDGVEEGPALEGTDLTLTVPALVPGHAKDARQICGR